MAEILDRELKKLKKMVSTISMNVEESMNKAIGSFIKHDSKLAKEVIEFDSTIDNLEIEIEEECLKILALHQPVAIDLRYIISIMKINNDLERIGDLATNIAHLVIMLEDKKRIDVHDIIPEMTDIVSRMLKNSLDALFNKDVDLAIKVQKTDDDVDILHSKMFSYISERIKIDNDLFDSLMPMLSASRCLERIADHCTNIAEDVEYFISGEITRHHHNS